MSELKLSGIFRESFLLLLKRPKLFIPKILLAILYGIGMITIASISIDTVVPLLYREMNREIALSIASQLPLLVLFFLYIILVLAVDVLINAMYPIMVNDFKLGKEVSFRKAVASAISRFPVIFPAVLIAEFVIAIPFSIVSSVFLLSRNLFALGFMSALFVIVSLVFTIGFYVIYPVSVLREKDFISAIVYTLRIDFKNAKKIVLPSLIPFALSLVSVVLAFLAGNPAFLLAFIVLRFAVAIVHTYHMVVNPSIYLGLVSQK